MKSLKHQLLAGLGAAALLFGATNLQAQSTLLAWETNGLSGVTADPFANTTTGSNMQSSNMTRGSGIAASSLSNAFAANGWNGPTNLATATTDSTYFQITAQAASGYSFSLDTIDWNARRSGTGPNNMQWVFSLDNFATAGTAIGSPISYTTAPTNGSAFSVDTSAITALQDVTGTATLRLYAWGASGGPGTMAIGRLSGNDLELLGSTQSSAPPAANNNSVLSAPATSAFGRVMSGSSQSVTVSNTGDATTYGASSTGGFSPTATGSVTENGTSNLTVGVGSTLGSRSGTLTVTNTAPDSNGPGQGSAQAPIASSLSATVVQDRVLDAGTVAATTEGGIDLGRQMLGTVTGTHTVTSAGADVENTRLTFSETADNTFGGYAASGLAEIRATNADGVDVVLNGSNNMNIAYELDFTQTGARANDSQFILFNTGNGISGEDLAGEAVLGGQPNDGQLRVYIQNATIVDNREIDATGVDLGSVLVGSTTGAQTTTLTTTGDDDNFTRVTVDGTSASNDGVTIATGSDQEFTDASDSNTRSITGNFATSGSKNVDVDFNITGEGLANESVNAVTVNATANVYQAADLTTNDSTPLGDAASITVANADTTDGGQRAAAEIVTRTVSGDGWDVTGLNTGTTIDQNANVFGTTSFNAAASGLLNGAISTGTLLLGFQHADQSIQGTAANDLGTTTWNFEAVVSGNASGNGEANIADGGSFSGLRIQRSGVGTASLLGGIASDDRGIEMTLNSSPIGFGVGTNDAAIGDYLSLSGTGSDTFVLSLSYSGTPDEAFIQWWNGSSWVNAIDGNSVAGGSFFSDTAYNSATHFSLGNYGFDSVSNTAWAVLDHNSDFVVAIPEPATWLLVGLGLSVLIYRRRRSTQTA
jgi:hypothetical protein